MKSIQIKNSYNIWKPSRQKLYANTETLTKYGRLTAAGCLNRSWRSIYIEWWLHNIGYYVTKPFCRIEWIKGINLRCKDVDLEER
jgi:hypothetical protein